MGIARVPSFSDRPGFPAGLRIILIEPDGQDCKALGAQLRECSYEVCECADETEASQHISKAEQEFDLLICEASVVAQESAAWPAFVRKVKHLPLVLTGENISQQQKLLGIEFGAVDFLEKPVALLKLRNVWQHTVRKMMKQKSTASLPEAIDPPSGLKPRPGCGTRPGTSADKPPVECTQESTGSSQADTASQADGSMLKVKKCDRKVRSTSDLRATRRSNPAAKPPGDKAASATAAPAAQPNGCAAVPGTSVSAPPEAAAAAPAAQPAYAMPQMQQPSMVPYNPQGMPAPLPGCVWGLPMLPPMVPGMMPPMAMPQPPMMMPAHHAQHAHMPWAPQPAYGGMMYGHALPQGGTAGLPVGPSAAGVPAPAMGAACIPAPAAPCGSATGSDVVMSSPVAAAGRKPEGGAASAATWSRGDASVATQLHKVDWDTEDGIVDDVFGLGAGADDLHDFSDSLLQADGEGCSGKGGPAAVEEGLSWMHDECLMDDLKPADERGPFLDVAA